jgi:hypothetical protein
MHVNYRTNARTMTAVVGSAVAAVLMSAQAQAAPAYRAWFIYPAEG